jgi:Septum formation/Domain of unknown function (DUF4190)
MTTTVRRVTTQPPPEAGGDTGDGASPAPPNPYASAEPSAPPPYGSSPAHGSSPPAHGPSPGYGPPPAYGPPPGYGPPYDDGSKRGTDGFAIAALIFSIIGGVLLSVVFGIVALTRIRRSGRRGRGLAIAALVISALWVIALGALIAVAVLSSAQRDDSGAVTKAGSMSASDLREGDCLRMAPKDDQGVGSVDVTPCASPHRAEVYAVFDLPAEPYPGDSRVQQLADQGCQDRTPDISGTDTSTLEALYLYPQQRQWDSGERSVSCIISSPAELRGKLVP